MDYIKHLTKDILPFWLNNAIDYDNGGIFTQLDEKGNIYGEEKSVWFQGRALYVFSLAYNHGIKDEKLLTAAKNIFDFLPKCSDESLRMAFTVTKYGKEIQKRRYWFSETFAAIGCCEYWLASGNEKAKILAEKYFDVAYGIYKNPDRTTPKFNTENLKLHSLSPCMILLSTAHVLRKINQEKYDAIADDMTKDILMHLTGKGLLENVSPNGEFIDTPTGRIVNPGHSLEAAWFLMVQSEFTKDETLFTKAKEIIDVSMKLGLYDGGIISFCDCDGKPATALEWDMKLWWPQCEAMLANKLCYLKTGEKKYLDWYNLIENYVEKHFIDHKNGEWYGYLHYDGTVSNTLKGNIFKGPFHIPRMLILLDKMDKLAKI